MAGQTKISALTTTTSLANGDIIHVVVNPASTPVNRSITFTAFGDQLIAAKNLANTSQANAAAQINAFSFIEVANSTTLEAGQSNDVLRFSNGVGIEISTDGSANVIITTANNTQEQRVRVANSGANVGDARPIINFTQSGNTSNFIINFSENIGNDSIDIDIEVPDKSISDLTDADTTGVANGGILVYDDTGNTDTTGFVSTGYVSIDQLMPAATLYVVAYDAGANAVTMDPLTGSDLPTPYALSGTTIAFKIPEDPSITFKLTDNSDVDLTSGISHVSVSGDYTTGNVAAANGTLYWNISPSIAAGNYKYVVTAQSGAVTKTGFIVVKDITAL